MKVIYFLCYHEGLREMFTKYTNFASTARKARITDADKISSSSVQSLGDRKIKQHE